MTILPVSDTLSDSAALCDAVVRLRGAALVTELGRIAGSVMASAHGEFLPSASGDTLIAHAESGLLQEISFDGHCFGHYRVAGKHSYDETDRRQLSSLASLTAGVLQVHSLAQRSTHAFAQVEALLAQQTQILDQLHESVLTMDLTGYITSWNKGAERLFGYSSVEAVGRNILFLYEDEDTGFHDAFLEQGGRLMEVRRRKKSGEIFWASLSLSPLRDLDERPVGLIAYLTDITERKLAEERLHHLAYYDALTSLPNRTLLTKLVDQALSVAQRSKMLGCMLFIDLNRFKLINDTLGRRVGDELLRQVSVRFRHVLRDQDLVARLSGDEFAVGLFDISQHFEASTVAQKLLASLVEPFLIEGHDLRVGASIGISVYPQDGHDAETLLRLADIAMYRAKQDGGGDAESVAFYSQDMNLGMQARMRLETGLRHALAEHQLLLHYQPKYALGSGRMIGAEALVRWRHPVHGMIPPADFIPLAESTGLVVQVGEWVLEAACAQAQAWKQAGLPPIRIAVNVSAREFTSALPARVAAMLERYGLEAAWLELEITESTLMHNIERVIGIMDRITALGVALSLDDFGTGYSSLAYLQRLPVNEVKIDKFFVLAMANDDGAEAIVRSVLDLARNLGLHSVAEGVEDRAAFDRLVGLGCAEAQGYFMSRPLPADATLDAPEVLRDVLARTDAAAGLTAATSS